MGCRRRIALIDSAVVAAVAVAVAAAVDVVAVVYFVDLELAAVMDRAG